MKKSYVLILATLLVTVLLAGCGGGSGSAVSPVQAQASPDKTYTPIFATHQLPLTATVRAFEFAQKELLEKTNGRFNMTVSH